MNTISWNFPNENDRSTKTFDPELPIIKVSGGSGKKVLFITDKLDKDELEKGVVLSGLQGKLLTSLVNKAKSTFIVRPEDKTFSWAAINFINARIDQHNKAELYEYFVKRVFSFIKKYKPDSIVCFSQRFLKYFYPEKFDNKGYENFGKYLGAFVEVKGYKIFPVIDLFDIIHAKGEEGLHGTLGIISKAIANGICGRLQFKLDVKRIKAAEIKVVKNIKQFNRLMDVLEQEPIICIDTETTNLNKVQNKLLTMQFCYDLDNAYVLPIYHKDTPFDAEELSYIAKRLKKFFEGKNKIKYFIYHNANFDLNVIRANFKIDFYPDNIFDTIAGIFCHEENMKYLNDAPGVDFKPFSLEATVVRYGFTEYGDSTIAKSESKNIQNLSLDDPKVLKYMCYDVLCPFCLHLIFLEEAKFLGYKKYLSIVTEQLSDTIHTFSTMNYYGLPVDIEYLMYLQSKESPILKVLKEYEQELYGCKEAVKFNKELMEEQHIPNQGLFGTIKTWLFDIHKRDHKTRFFFDKLGLKPIKLGKPDPKTGKQIGKVDKTFQEHYSENKTVQAFTELSKAEKLRDAFVKSFVKLLKSSADFKADFCIRPFIDFKGVVTGRVSEKYPNCQQIPSRSELGKHIKRLFIAPENYIFVKIDYSAHEVRGLALIAEDQVLADVFRVGFDLRKAFKFKPSKALDEEIELKGDVHKLNVQFFFSKDLKTIAKDELKKLRNAIKSVVFGLIYGKGNKSLSRDLGQPIEYVDGLVKKFFKRFQKSSKWLNDIEASARTKHYVESPLGRRRNLTAYLLPKSAPDAEGKYAAMDRRARNSPIQGMGSDFGFIGYRRIARRSWERLRKLKLKEVPLKVCNTVHDSLETVTHYNHIMWALKTIEIEMTDGVQQTCIERHNFHFPVPLEIDMELGPNARDLKKFDGTLSSLVEALAYTLAFQKYKMNYVFNKKLVKILESMFVDQQDDMPDFLKAQVKDNGFPDFESIMKAQIKEVKAYKYN